MRKLLILAGAATLFACGQSDAADITLYYMPGCPFCHYAKDFFNDELPDVKVEMVNVTEGGRAMERFREQLRECNSDSMGVPLIIVKGDCIQGYNEEIGARIKQAMGK